MSDESGYHAPTTYATGAESGPDCRFRSAGGLADRNLGAPNRVGRGLFRKARRRGLPT